MGRTIGEGFGKGGNSQFGTGQYVQSVPTIQTAKFRDFSGGYDASDQPEDTAPGSTPWSMNTYTDRKDRIARVPGTVTDEVFVEEPYLAAITITQASTNFSYTTLQYTAHGHDQNGDDFEITDDIAWAVDVGTIDDTGLCTMPTPSYAGPGPHVTATVGSVVGERDTGYAA